MKKGIIIILSIIFSLLILSLFLKEKKLIKQKEEISSLEQNYSNYKSKIKDSLLLEKKELILKQNKKIDSLQKILDFKTKQNLILIKNQKNEIKKFTIYSRKSYIDSLFRANKLR